MPERSQDSWFECPVLACRCAASAWHPAQELEQAAPGAQRSRPRLPPQHPWTADLGLPGAPRPRFGLDAGRGVALAATGWLMAARRLLAADLQSS